MQKLKFVDSNNNEIDLTDNINFGIVNWQGFSECANEVQSQTVPFEDGSVFLDTLLDDRELAVTIAIQDGGNLAKRYELKRKLIKLFNPKLGEGFLYYKNDFLEKRIKVISSLPVFPTKNIDEGGTLKADVSFTACNPYWEDVEVNIIKSNAPEQYGFGKYNAEIFSNGDTSLPVDINIMSTRSSGTKEITFSKKKNNVYEIEKRLTFSQDFLFTKITSGVGNKKINTYIPELLLSKITRSKYSENNIITSCYAWGKIYAFTDFENEMYVSKNLFENYDIIELGLPGKVVRMCRYSKKNDLIYILATNSTYSLGNNRIYAIDKNNVIHDTGIDCYTRFFEIAENEDSCYIIHDKTDETSSVTNNLIYLTKIDGYSEETSSYLTTINVTDFNFSVSRIYKADNGFSSFYARIYNKLYKIKIENVVSCVQDITFTNNFYVVTKNRFLNGAGEYFNTTRPHQISYNKTTNELSYVELSSTGNSRRAIVINHENYQFDANILTNRFILYYSETNGDYFTFGNYDSSFQQGFNNFIVENVENNFIFFLENMGKRCAIYTALPIRNLIADVSDLSIDFDEKGMLVESDNGFSISYRNKFIGV